VRLRSAAVLITAALLFPGSAALAAVELSVLSYNVHGLSWVFTRDDPGRNSPLIGRLAARYDVVLLQEDFEYGDEIAEPLGVRTIVQGNGMRPDPRLILAKILFFPFSLFLPGFSPPYGSGLTTATTLPVAPRGVVKHAYRECDGWFGGRSDCWASKGFLRVRIEVGDGIEIDLYNTHLDSGGDEAARTTRVTQLAELAEAIERDSGEVPLVVAGDLNLEPSRPGDGALLAAFRGRLGLVDTGAGPERPTWRRYEHIFVRGGGGVTVTTRASGEDLAFVSEDRPLSDHAAIYAWLALERARR
jgi:hypothetical protein